MLRSHTLCAFRGVVKRSPCHICSYIVMFSGLSGSIFDLGLAWLVLIQTMSGSIFSNLSIIQRLVVHFYNYYGFCVFGWCGMNETTDCSKTLKHPLDSYYIELNFTRCGGLKPIKPLLCTVLKIGGRTLYIVWVSIDLYLQLYSVTLCLPGWNLWYTLY